MKTAHVLNLWDAKKNSALKELNNYNNYIKI